MTEPEIVPPEARERAVAHWEQVVRPSMNLKEQAKPKETPEQALERLQAEANKPVTIGSELAVKLFAMRQEHQRAA